MRGYKNFLMLAAGCMVVMSFATSTVKAGMPTPDEEAPKDYYYVEGRTKSGEKREGPFDTPEKAFEVAARWEREHGEKGLSFAHPLLDGPHVYRVRGEKRELMKPAAVKPAPVPMDPKPSVARPGETVPLDLFQPLRDKKWVDIKPVEPVAGPFTSFKGTGVVEGAKITIELKANGDFFIDGEYAATGKWWFVSKESIVLDSKFVRFSGKVNGDTIKGDFRKIDVDGKTESRQPPWNATRIETQSTTPSVTVTPAVTPAKPKVDVAGPYTVWLWQDNHRVNTYIMYDTAEEAIKFARSQWDGWQKGNGEVKGTVATDAKGRAIAAFGQGR